MGDSPLAPGALLAPLIDYMAGKWDDLLGTALIAGALVWGIPFMFRWARLLIARSMISYYRWRLSRMD